MDALFLWRARREAKLKMMEDAMPFWAEKAYLVGNAVLARVEAEEADTGEDGASPQESAFQIKGEGDSGAFKHIYEHMKALGVKKRED